MNNSKTAKTMLIGLWVLIAAWLLYAWVERNEARKRLEIKTASVELQITMLEQEMRATQASGMTAARYRKEQTLHGEIAELYRSIGRDGMADYHRDVADDDRVMSRKLGEIDNKYRR